MLRKVTTHSLLTGTLVLALSAISAVAQTAQPASPASKPSASTTAPATVSAPPQKGMVWVNTASGAYHREGTKYYGKTKQGKYMTEADAQKAGYHLSKSDSKK